MLFYSSAKYYDKYRTQKLLNLLYEKNKKKPKQKKPTPKQQKTKTLNSRDLYPQLV